MRSFPIDLTAKALFPARVIRMTRLDGDIKLIAEADESLTVGSETFLPLPGCSVSAIKHIIDGDMPSMEIKFAHSFGGTMGSWALNTGRWDGTAVQVYPIDRNNITTLGDPLFTGIVDTVVIDAIGQGATFDIRGLAAKAEAFIQTYQPMDRTDLFSELNQLDPDDWKYTGTIDTIVDRHNFTVAGMSPSPPDDGWFNQGVFKTASGLKMVVANWVQSTLTITTYQGTCDSTNMTPGEAIDLYPGYDGTALQAREKFSNKINFQGEDHFLGIKSITGV